MNKKQMYVIKRNNKRELVSYDKILKRITVLTKMKPKLNVDIYHISKLIIDQIYPDIPTHELDEFASKMCMELALENPDFGELSKRILVSNMHKSYVCNTFSEMYFLLDHLQNEKILQILNDPELKEKIDTYIKLEKDYLLDYFGLQTLSRSYLIQKNGKMESPQYLFMRVALGLYKDVVLKTKDLSDVFETYNLLSSLSMTHATPTLFNSGTKTEQNSSCFLMGIEDSITGIMKAMSDMAQISKYAGGIGVHISDIRSKGSLIKGTNGKSSGIIPMLKVINELGKYVNQGGKRNGSIACFIEPHHPDILDFLKIRNNTTDQELACRNLFTAVWVSDLFMECVEKDLDWYLMDPDTCPGLNDVYAEKYVELYQKYIEEKKYNKVIKARSIWDEIIRAQTLSGTPYIGFKDHINRKNAQSNIGIIKSSNLCHEILLYSDSKHYAVCNLASICLSKCIDHHKKTLDVKKLTSITKQCVKNLNQVIDVNYYPVPETKKTNDSTRPIGIGVQGLANLFYTLRIPFDSEEAKVLNKLIFETIQLAALEMSCELAQKDGAYPYFQGSPASQGYFQHNLWGIDESTLNYPKQWEKLRQNVKLHGLRNSVVTALMPTASTSQIMGNFESFEPITSNIFRRNTLAGEFVVINKYLVEDLQKLNLWSIQMKDRIIMNNGSIQKIVEIPEEIRNLYKTVWEIKQKDLLDLCIQRGPFIDQTQSMNLYYSGTKEQMYNKLTSMYFYGWKNGLKTGLYYLRSKPSTEAISYKTEEECLSCSA